jgi:hypothetical protein
VRSEQADERSKSGTAAVIDCNTDTLCCKQGGNRIHKFVVLPPAGLQSFQLASPNPFSLASPRQLQCPAAPRWVRWLKSAIADAVDAVCSPIAATERWRAAAEFLSRIRALMNSAFVQVNFLFELASDQLTPFMEKEAFVSVSRFFRELLLQLRCFVRFVVTTALDFILHCCASESWDRDSLLTAIFQLALAHLLLAINLVTQLRWSSPRSKKLATPFMKPTGAQEHKRSAAEDIPQIIPLPVAPRREARSLLSADAEWNKDLGSRI